MLYLCTKPAMTFCLRYFSLLKILARSIYIVGVNLKNQTVELLTLVFRANIWKDKEQVLLVF